MPDIKAAPASTARIYSFEPFHFSNNLPPETRDKLKTIFSHWSDSEKAETLVREIIDQAPDTLGVRIVAYRFYFYRRRSLEAADWALSCLAWISRRLGLPDDWRQVSPEMADFKHWHAYTRLWLQSLTALAKVEELDPQGNLGAPRLRQVFTRPHRDAGMVFPKDDENWRAPCPIDEDCLEEA